MKTVFRKNVISWIFYDWANSAFATTVMAGFFPLFFKKYWCIGANVTESTFKLGVANSIASIIIAVLAPVLGAIADKGSLKKKFLIFFLVRNLIRMAMGAPLLFGIAVYTSTFLIEA